jgi:putative FmdB family regulatory protein
MPTYDYRCSACGHTLEVFQSMRDAPKRKCPACRKPKLARMIGSGAAILFKGGGFHRTDYRSESYKKAESADKPASDPSPTCKPASPGGAGGNGACAKPDCPN